MHELGSFQNSQIGSFSITIKRVSFCHHQDLLHRNHGKGIILTTEKSTQWSPGVCGFIYSVGRGTAEVRILSGRPFSETEAQGKALRPGCEVWMGMGGNKRTMTSNLAQQGFLKRESPGISQKDQRQEGAQCTHIVWAVKHKLMLLLTQTPELSSESLNKAGDSFMKYK